MNVGNRSLRTVRNAARCAALIALATIGGRAVAHHAFATEFEASLTGEVKGEVTGVWWQNPHVRYDVAMKLPDGRMRDVGVAAARQSARLPDAELERADHEVGMQAVGQGQSRPRRRQEALRHVHQSR